LRADYHHSGSARIANRKVHIAPLVATTTILMIRTLV
jgi:hypothetical protein